MNQQMIKQVLNESDSIIFGENWLDASFETQLDRVNSRHAFVQPSNLKSAAELLHHLLVWRKELLSRLSGDPAVKLRMSDESNWLPLEKLRATGWEPIVQDFYSSQEKFKEVLSGQQDDFLLQVHQCSGYTFEQLSRSLIHHDIYHLGQIGITIKHLDI